MPFILDKAKLHAPNIAAKESSNGSIDAKQGRKMWATARKTVNRRHHLTVVETNMVVRKAKKKG